MSGVLPAPSEVLLRQQWAFLLHQLLNAPDGKLPQAAANKAIPKQIQEQLTLTGKAATDLRAKMAAAGWLGEEKNGRIVTYSITEAGKHQLRDLARYVPLLPAKGGDSPPADDRMRGAREVYVLDALARAADQTMSKADVAAFRNQHCLGLNPGTTRAVLSELALRGDISVHRTADSESYSLTHIGTEFLGRLRGEYPILPPAGKPTAAPNESVRLGREAFLLLKLLQSAKYTCWESDAALGSYPKPLKLNHATAWRARGELAAAGYIVTHWDGKEGSYTLTASGKRRLASLPFDELGEVKIKGSALTELLAAAREETNPTPRETPTPTEPQAPRAALTDAQLETAVMDIFHELLGGQYANLHMVPIHEIRKAVAERFGPDAASHAVFNDRMLALRRAKQVRLISIDDRSRATPEQLRDSVFAVGETFFYVEKPHAPA
ncbi:MAG: hypothetical protein JWO38_294 [Gemmataceae bacterium]|nr:hypothetical protein [Gemmataceae bacterium]